MGILQERNGRGEQGKMTTTVLFQGICLSIISISIVWCLVSLHKKADAIIGLTIHKMYAMYRLNGMSADSAEDLTKTAITIAYGGSLDDGIKILKRHCKESGWNTQGTEKDEQRADDR